MQLVTFPVKKHTDLNLLLDVIRKFGYEPNVVNEEDLQMKARKAMVKYSKSFKRVNISSKNLDLLVNEAVNTKC